jgi:DNA-binding response OmpR family regulator
VRTVLLADAASSVRALLRAILERDDLAFVEVADSTGAFLAMTEHRPALVLLDLDLPPAGGLELLTRIREVSDDVPIIVLALRDSTLEGRACFARGADELLLKPLDPARLVACVDEALGTPIMAEALPGGQR